MAYDQALKDKGLFKQIETPVIEEPGLPIISSPSGAILQSGMFTSPNYRKGNAGWMVDALGNFEGNSGTFRGNLSGNNFTVGTAGWIKGGQTDYATDTGFFLGYSGGAYKFSAGDSTNYLRWTGSAFETSGIALSKTIRAYFSGDTITAGQPVSIYAYAQADGGITYNNKVTDAGGGSISSLTTSLTIGNNSNRVLVVFVAITDNALTIGVTYNGVAMTLVDTQNYGSIGRTMSSFILVNPATGANNIVVSTNGNCGIAMSAYSYYNVAQSGQPDVNSKLGGTGNLTKTLDTLSTTSVIISAVGDDGSSGVYGDVKFNTVAGLNAQGAQSNSPGLGSGTTEIVNATQTITILGTPSTNGTGLLNICLKPYSTPQVGVVKASASTQLNMKNAFIGFADANIALGGTGNIVLAGEATGLSGLVVGTKYFVQNTAGTLGTSAGTNSIIAGMGLSTTTLLIKNIS